MEAFFQFQRYECLARLLILNRRTLIMILNDEDVPDIARFLYTVMFADRIAKIISEMIEIFDVF